MQPIPSLKILSLGWGVQSTTLAMMAALGEIEKPDFAVHSDTTHEHQHTYEYVKKWSAFLEEHGVKVITVTDKAGAGLTVQWRTMATVQIPAYTTKADGKGGRIPRACTQDWKLTPQRQWISARLKELGYTKKPESVEMWVGISMDEVERMKPADVKYIKNRWPLIEKNMTRNDCVDWLKAHDIEVPGKSSCTFCPFHNKAGWKDLALKGGKDWEDAVAADEFIRDFRAPMKLYVQSQRIPLRDLEKIIKGEADAQQLELFENVSDECKGVCFV